MHWLALIIAGCFEIMWAVGFKYTCGLTKLVPTIFTAVTMVISFVFLSYALRAIPVGTGYAIWSGIGASGTLLFGICFLGESRDPVRIGAILMIVVCILVLKITHK